MSFFITFYFPYLILLYYPKCLIKKTFERNKHVTCKKFISVGVCTPKGKETSTFYNIPQRGEVNSKWLIGKAKGDKHSASPLSHFIIVIGKVLAPRYNFSHVSMTSVKFIETLVSL